MPLLTHTHPDPPLEGEGNSLSLRERVRVRVGIFMRLSEPAAHDGSTENNFSNSPLPPFSKGGNLFSPYENGGMGGLFLSSSVSFWRMNIFILTGVNWQVI